MPNSKVLGVVFGSRSDSEHVSKVTAQLNARGWEYLQLGNSAGIYVPGHGMAYTIDAGSVHRDPLGTLAYASNLSRGVAVHGNMLIFLTCIGLRDEASGLISSYTGRRVVAVPPDTKEYGRYPSGVRVMPFSSQMPRDADIYAALDWAEHEFNKTEWDEEDAASAQAMEKARSALSSLRDGIADGKITF